MSLASFCGLRSCNSTVLPGGATEGVWFLRDAGGSVVELSNCARESLSALVLVFIGAGILALAVHRDWAAKWGPKRRAQALPAWGSVELVLCILLGLVQPARLLWDGFINEVVLPASRLTDGVVSVMVLIGLHQHVLVVRGRVGCRTFTRLLLPFMWTAAATTFAWSMHSAIVTVQVVSSGSWGGESLATLLCASLQTVALGTLATVVTLRPPRRILDWRARAAKARRLGAAQRDINDRSPASLFNRDDEAAVALLDDLQDPPAMLSDSDDEGGSGKGAGAPRGGGRGLWAPLLAEICRLVWPREWALRLRLGACIACLVAGRVVTLLVPITYKRMIDELAAISQVWPPLSRACSLSLPPAPSLAPSPPLTHRPARPAFPISPPYTHSKAQGARHHIAGTAAGRRRQHILRHRHVGSLALHSGAVPYGRRRRVSGPARQCPQLPLDPG